MVQRYEHHMNLKEDALCPFKYSVLKNQRECVCNWHRNLEILMVEAGNCRVQCGRENAALSAHDLAVVNSETIHRLYSETAVDYHCLIFDEGFCAENGIKPDEYRFESFFRDEKTEKLCLAVKTRMEEYRREPTGLQAARLRIAVLAVLINLCTEHAVPASEAPPSADSSSGACVRKALEYINDHIAEEITLDSLAAYCGVTKYHLARRAGHYMGQTLFTYINTLRCKKAEEYLMRGMSVTEAASTCGFDSLSYFSRTYKKLMGYTPSGRTHKKES